MPKRKRHLTQPPFGGLKRNVYVLHPMAVPKGAAPEGAVERAYVWVLSLETPYGPMVDCYDGSRANAMAWASSLLGRMAVMGQRSELRCRTMSGRFGESRTFPRSSDPRRSKG